jgi:hypothetical protein
MKPLAFQVTPLNSVKWLFCPLRSNHVVPVPGYELAFAASRWTSSEVDATAGFATHAPLLSV